MLSHLGLGMIEFRPHRFHDLTEAFQILPHVLKLDSLLLIQKLMKIHNWTITTQQWQLILITYTKLKVDTYCLNTLV